MEAIYHYCTPDAFISIVSSRKIRLSSLSLSNDLAEGKLLPQLFMEALDKEDPSPAAREALKESIESLGHFFEGLGFCLSGARDLLSQWRGYASDGQGFAIGFSKDYLVKLQSEREEKDWSLMIADVIYDKISQLVLVNKIIEEIKNTVSLNLINPYRMHSLLTTGLIEPKEEEVEKFKNELTNIYSASIHALPKLYCLKNPAFREEQEVRLISLLAKDQSETCAFRPGPNRIIPYREFALRPCGIPAIQEVVLGPKNISPKHMVKKFLTQNGFQDVTISQSSATYR